MGAGSAPNSGLRRNRSGRLVAAAEIKPAAGGASHAITPPLADISLRPGNQRVFIFLLCGSRRETIQSSARRPPRLQVSHENSFLPMGPRLVYEACSLQAGLGPDFAGAQS